MRFDCGEQAATKKNNPLTAMGCAVEFEKFASESDVAAFRELLKRQVPTADLRS